MYDPLLRARKDALSELIDSLSDEEYEVAIKAIDTFFDCIEEEVPQIAHLVVEENSTIDILVVDDNDSSI